MKNKKLVLVFLGLLCLSALLCAQNPPTVYQHSDYGGYAVSLEAGFYSVGMSGAMGVNNTVIVLFFKHCAPSNISATQTWRLQ